MYVLRSNCGHYLDTKVPLKIYDVAKNKANLNCSDARTML